MVPFHGVPPAPPTLRSQSLPSDANGQSLAYVYSRENDPDVQCLLTLRNHSINSCGVRGPSFPMRWTPIASLKTSQLG
jgi:hypothetical protein